MMQVQQAVKEKCSYWLEWRQMGTAFYATMQIEEPESTVSRNANCVKRVRLTKEEANMSLIDLMQKYPRIYVPPVNYKQRIVMPIYDLEKKKIAFAIAIYGLTRLDISGKEGHQALVLALQRRGLDPARYQASPHDVADCESHNYEPPEKRK